MNVDGKILSTYKGFNLLDYSYSNLFEKVQMANVKEIKSARNIDYFIAWLGFFARRKLHDFICCLKKLWDTGPWWGFFFHFFAFWERFNSFALINGLFWGGWLKICFLLKNKLKEKAMIGAMSCTNCVIDLISPDS